MNDGETVFSRGSDKIEGSNESVHVRGSDVVFGEIPKAIAPAAFVPLKPFHASKHKAAEVEGASCFVCGKALGPVVGTYVRGIGFRHTTTCEERGPKRLVLVESPYKGGGDRVDYARAALLDSLGRNEAPMLSHLLYTQVLDDDTPTDRYTGMLAGWAWLDVVAAVVVYDDLGISNGMAEGITRARSVGVPIERRQIPGWTTQHRKEGN
ncbi:hypothetical protein LCGC14_0663230 [marine sediment metagenome]|uniref:DUF7768 domain-containing protein n=1 Tax=marine sediment metagenome TaxID=412755 RepID=A0A0F9QT14_9ZZZZ